jgi:hypothetical protein
MFAAIPWISLSGCWLVFDFEFPPLIPSCQQALLSLVSEAAVWAVRVVGLLVCRLTAHAMRVSSFVWWW